MTIKDEVLWDKRISAVSRQIRLGVLLDYLVPSLNFFIIFSIIIGSFLIQGFILDKAAFLYIFFVIFPIFILSLIFYSLVFSPKIKAVKSFDYIVSLVDKINSLNGSLIVCKSSDVNEFPEFKNISKLVFKPLYIALLVFPILVFICWSCFVRQPTYNKLLQVNEVPEIWSEIEDAISLLEDIDSEELDSIKDSFTELQGIQGAEKFSTESLDKAESILNAAKRSLDETQGKGKPHMDSGATTSMHKSDLADKTDKLGELPLTSQDLAKLKEEVDKKKANSNGSRKNNSGKNSSKKSQSGEQSSGQGKEKGQRGSEGGSGQQQNNPRQRNKKPNDDSSAGGISKGEKALPAPLNFGDRVRVKGGKKVWIVEDPLDDSSESIGKVDSRSNKPSPSVKLPDVQYKKGTTKDFESYRNNYNLEDSEFLDRMYTHPK